jgi:hypothetical protein
MLFHMLLFTYMVTKKWSDLMICAPAPSEFQHPEFQHPLSSSIYGIPEQAAETGAAVLPI